MSSHTRPSRFALPAQNMQPRKLVVSMDVQLSLLLTRRLYGCFKHRALTIRADTAASSKLRARINAVAIGVQIPIDS